MKIRKKTKSSEIAKPCEALLTWRRSQTYSLKGNYKLWFPSKKDLHVMVLYLYLSCLFTAAEVLKLNNFKGKQCLFTFHAS